ncbi:MAG TPA: hypothetical protein DFS52_15570 [Myxococcales bacterium]|nr:hypothetical protein [Myxococcales bacterium]
MRTLSLAMLSALLLAAAPGSEPASAEKSGAPSPEAVVPAAAAADDSAPSAAEGKEGAQEDEPVGVGPETFDEALELHYGGTPREAAPLFFQYVRGSARTADNYEWAQYFLGNDLAQLGFTHAAFNFYAEVAKTRSRAEVLPVVLGALEKLSARTVYDAELVEREVLGGTDFGFVPASVRDYVRFHKGMVDYRNGHLRWAWGHFDKLEQGSGYHARARLVRAVHKLEKENAPEPALAELEALSADEKAPREVRNDARVAVARLRFERGEYKKAHVAYDAVELPELDPGRGQLYLEKAWTYYRMGEASQAMGLLLALDAPSFRELFLPEKYVLASLIYKDRCHYLPAKRAARGFTRRYGPALRLVRERGDLKSDERLLAAALQIEPASRRAGELVARLELERDLIDAYASRFEASGLTRRLRQLYERALAEAIRQREIALEHALAAAADRLLREEEQVRLLDYEIGLDLYKRVKKGALLAEAQAIDLAADEDAVVYPFDGEYWNDELMDFRLDLPSRCAAAEGDR